MNKVILKLVQERDNFLRSNHVEEKGLVIFGPSFSIFEPSKLTDEILAISLQLRGFKVLPIYCDQVQDNQCAVFGGSWGGGKEFKRNCKSCASSSKQMWDGIAPITKLSSFLTGHASEIDALKLEAYGVEGLIDFSFKGVPLGSMSVDILRNMYTVYNLSLIPDLQHNLLSEIKNLIKLHISYERLIIEKEPAVIISNDSFYGMWGVLEHLAKKHNVPFYSTWPQLKTSRLAIGFNAPSMNLDMKEMWSGFKNRELTDADELFIDSWLNRSVGSLSDSHSNDVVSTHRIAEADKPTAILCTNVIWDLAALNKHRVFPDMVTWVLETIDWFKEHPEFELIIRPHPVENDPAIPTTRENIKNEILKAFGNLPTNVEIHDSELMFNKSLFETSEVFLVHTTTLGLEAAARGLQVLTVGNAPYSSFGFTNDPLSRKEYFASLYELLTNPRDLDDSRLQSARKFLLMYQKYYYINVGIVESGWGASSEILCRGIIDLLPGANSILDFVLGQVSSGEPIFSSLNWPGKNE